VDACGHRRLCIPRESGSGSNTPLATTPNLPVRRNPVSRPTGIGIDGGEEVEANSGSHYVRGSRAVPYEKRRGVRRLFTLRRLASAATTMVLAVTFSSISTAGASTETVTSGGLTAAFTYHGSNPQSRASHLTISMSGQVLYDQVVRSAWCGNECSPNVIAGARSVLHVVHPQTKEQLAVVLDLYSGGAHCCSVEQVFSFNANSRTFVKSERNFGDPGVRIVDLGVGRSVDFLSADDAFAYAFTDYAASGMPIEILGFSHHSFHNVTRSFPSLIARDAREWMTAFDAQSGGHYQDTVGVVAAWAADEDMLGHSSAVTSFLSAQMREGHLNSSLSPVASSGQKFVVELQKFLRQHGYVNGHA
jgi:hypothetical protein